MNTNRQQNSRNGRIERISEGLYHCRGGDVAIDLFMNEKILKANDVNGAIHHLVSLLSGYTIEGPIAVLPDFTLSNTLPIGTTVLLNSNKAINPSFIGMDLGCGYHLFSVAMNPKRFLKKGKFKYRTTAELVDHISAHLANNKVTYSENIFNAILRQGPAALDHNQHQDGKLEVSVPLDGIGKVLKHHFGSIGKGNHFVDLFVIDKVYDSGACENHEIDTKRVYFLIHTGSRQFGFEVYSFFTRLFKESHGSDSFNSGYLQGFQEALNYATANRYYVKKLIDIALEDFHGCEISTTTLLDKAHNEIRILENGPFFKIQKGTTTLNAGEISIIPGTCADPAYIVLGTEGVKAAHNTLNHGVGRKYTRSQLFSKFRRTKYSHFFKDIALNVSPKQMIEEIPVGYKNIEDVMNSVETSNLARRIARLRPVGVIVSR